MTTTALLFSLKILWASANEIPGERIKRIIIKNSALLWLIIIFSPQIPQRVKDFSPNSTRRGSYQPHNPLQLQRIILLFSSPYILCRLQFYTLCPDLIYQRNPCIIFVILEGYGNRFNPCVYRACNLKKFSPIFITVFPKIRRHYSNVYVAIFACFSR